MWKQIQKKLRSRSGETLVEVLIALMIIALSSMLLVVMITTAASIDMSTRSRDETFYEDLTRAETRPADDAAGSGQIQIEIAGSTPAPLDVTVYGGNRLASYAKPTPVPTEVAP